MNDHVAEPLRAILNGATRVTDFRVDTVEMSVDDFWALPQDTRRLIEVYGRNLVEQQGRVTFEMAIYRWEEIQNSLRRLGAG